MIAPLCVPRLQAMCLLVVGASRGRHSNEFWPDKTLHPGSLSGQWPKPLARLQAMNMRAAEAIVSSAPNPMKTFPIREVWPQTDVSPVIVAAGGAGVAATGA